MAPRPGRRRRRVTELAAVARRLLEVVTEDLVGSGAWPPRVAASQVAKRSCNSDRACFARPMYAASLIRHIPERKASSPGKDADAARTSSLRTRLIKRESRLSALQRRERDEGAEVKRLALDRGAFE